MKPPEKIKKSIDAVPNTPVFLAGLHTNFKYENPPHIQLIEKYLLDVYLGKIKRLIISAPPRHGKSELVSRYFPSWYLINDPDADIIIATYAADFAANDIGLPVRDIVNEFGYLNQLRPVSLRQDSNAKDRFNIRDAKGVFRCVGIGGQMTGRGAKLLIIDDPHKNDKDALSKVGRDNVYNWYQSVARSRLSPDGAVIIIMTRWHKDDLVGKILNHNPDKWTVLNLPAVAEDNDILGRSPGEALWERRYSIENLNEIKADISPFWWSAQYQQQPIASEYQIFNPDKWNFFDDNPLGAVIQCWDTAAKDGQLNDPSACTTWVVNDTGFFLVDCFNERILYPQLRQTAIDLAHVWNPDIILIEDSSTGLSLIPDLKRSLRLPIKGIQPMNKVVRSHLVSPLFESGKIFIKRSPWAEKVIMQFTDFPQGDHDDMVDSGTIALNYAKRLKPESPLNGNGHNGNGNGKHYQDVIESVKLKRESYFTNY